MPPARRRAGGSRGEGDPGKRYEELPEAVRLHEEYLKYRLEGGEPPTPELYLKAVEAFRQLPGAIRSKPGTPPPEPPDDDDGEADQSSGEGER